MRAISSSRLIQFSLSSILLSLLSTTVAASSVNSDASNNSARTDNSTAIVQLNGDPVSLFGRSGLAKGKKIDLNNSVVVSYRAQLAQKRNSFKAWLRDNAPNAKVTGEFDISLNAVSVQLNGTLVSTIATAPMVQHAEYESIFYPTASDPDLSLISAQAAWASGGGFSHAGDGVKVAIIDSGIDIKHPCFSDTGYATQTRVGDMQLTNNKVIAAKVFNNKANVRELNAEAVNPHGTHVAGTVACNYETPTIVNGVAIPYGISGVAPRALLGNYNIFPGHVDNARSEDILNALEAAYADGFDVANMSIGGGASGVQDLVTVAVDNLDQANMVVAVAAGNSGPGHYTVSSPGSAQRALTAGASTVGHSVGTPITVEEVNASGVAGEFQVVSADLIRVLAVVTESPINPTTGISEACSPLNSNLSGSIALISRGTCAFSAKIRNAQLAGAVAVLVVNNVGGDGIAMASDGTPNQPTIPAYSVSLSDGTLLKTKNGKLTTIGSTLVYFNTSNNDVMAGFSSQGPTDVDFRIKPDVVAPGVNVLSSVPVYLCSGNPCFDFYQGTSMATPHLAGSAAIVRWAHPSWTAAHIRSAIVNTADQNVLRRSNSISTERDVNVIGSGRENLLSAINASVSLDPLSISFGSIPSGSGQSKIFPVTITNLQGAATFDFTIDAGNGGITFDVESGSVNLGNGESKTINVTLSSTHDTSPGNHQATLRIIKNGIEVAHAAAFVFMK